CLPSGTPVHSRWLTPRVTVRDSHPDAVSRPDHPEGYYGRPFRHPGSRDAVSRLLPRRGSYPTTRRPGAPAGPNLGAASEVGTPGGLPRTKSLNRWRSLAYRRWLDAEDWSEADCYRPSKAGASVHA